MSAEWRRLWAQGEEPTTEDRLRENRCAGLARRNRMSFPSRVRVIHPTWGEIVVPGASLFAAILCAAELWGCDWLEIMDARVEAEDIKKTRPGRGRSKRTPPDKERRSSPHHYSMGAEKRQ